MKYLLCSILFFSIQSMFSQTPVIQFSVTPDIIDPGDTVELKWKVEHAVYVYLSYSGDSVGLHGNKIIVPTNSMNLYIYAQDSTGGESTENATITVLGSRDEACPNPNLFVGDGVASYEKKFPNLDVFKFEEILKTILQDSLMFPNLNDRDVKGTITSPCIERKDLLTKQEQDHNFTKRMVCQYCYHNDKDRTLIFVFKIVFQTKRSNGSKWNTVPISDSGQAKKYFSEYKKVSAMLEQKIQDIE